MPCPKDDENDDDAADDDYWESFFNWKDSDFDVWIHGICYLISQYLQVG